MGVYLSEPETKKNSVTGNHKNMKFASAEMQGRGRCIQGGEKTWRMQQFTSSILEMGTAYLRFLMAMEVCKKNIDRALG